MTVEDEIKAAHLLLLKRARAKGFVTYDDIDELLPSDMTDPEVIDRVFSELAAAGVELVERPWEYPALAHNNRASPSLRGFRTTDMACFIATRSELQAAFPGWRVPLPQAIMRTFPNPFTGEPVFGRTRDPGPDIEPSVPETLPFDHVLLPPVEDWEDRYLALDLALSGEEPTARSLDVEELLQVLAARGLCDEALCAGNVDYFLWVVPPRVQRALCAVERTSLPTVLADWNRRSPRENLLQELIDFCALATRAGSDREMFLWLPASREHDA